VPPRQNFGVVQDSVLCGLFERQRFGSLRMGGWRQAKYQKA
jgi:hypothetical protein